ncbi:hypothetical protein [Mycobacterium sp.]|uniref:hypothetical protein n=1 Tax=Mycobacterium sp. TaxID=1785 RepID=UPI003A8BEFAC
MPGIAEIALGAAPIAGGALLGAVAGNLKAPDVRAVIKPDLDMLDRIPEDQVQRRAALSQMVGARIDDLVTADQRGRELRQAAASYHGSWRDIVVFICTVLFTIVWWHVSHHHANWLPMFVALIVMSMIAGAYAARSTVRALAQLLRRTPTAAARHSAQYRPRRGSRHV